MRTGDCGDHGGEGHGGEGDLTWRSLDRRFGLRIPTRMQMRLHDWCLRSGHYETGGVLVGRYAQALDCAIVTAVAPAPRDSRRGRAWFERGTLGLQMWLDGIWRAHRNYYLGEWHYHPYATPDPSPADRAQMRRIARDQRAHCPEPVLVILGGDPSATWETAAFVFLADSAEAIPLIRDNANVSAGGER